MRPKVSKHRKPRYQQSAHTRYSEDGDDFPRTHISNRKRRALLESQMEESERAEEYDYLLMGSVRRERGY